MRKTLLGLAAAAFAMGSMLGAAQAGERMELNDLGLSTPESVLYDAQNDVYLVSNINGNPSAADGNGYISRISPDGRVLDLKWIDGEAEGVALNGPKGMAISGGVLYVSDITDVRLFDANTGAAMGSVAIAGAAFLNDAVAGPDGSVYVSDSGISFATGEMQVVPGADAIYRVDASGATKLVGGDLDRPNGLAVKDGTILMVAFGNKGLLLGYGPDGASQSSKETGLGGLDGIEILPDGSALISSWATGAVHKLTPGGESSIVVENVPTPADLGYDTKRNRVLIPIFTENRLVFVDLD